VTGAGRTPTPVAASPHRPVVDAATVVAIAAVAISLNVAAHEGVHALTCLAVGGRLLEYSALYVSCTAPSPLLERLVDGSAPLYNLLAGALLWLALRRRSARATGRHFFLWLLMLMNGLYGAGYWMFSGIADVGDMATVIHGWEPGGLWRALMTVAGSALFLGVVWLALRALGRMVGGDADERIGRAGRLGRLSYATAVAVVLLAGCFSPPGPLSLPVTAGLAAAGGGLSPLLWMMQWFRAAYFPKLPLPPLEIPRTWRWLAAAVVVTGLYVGVLGRTLRP
jgi:hypothetical protein